MQVQFLVEILFNRRLVEQLIDSLGGVQSAVMALVAGTLLACALMPHSCRTPGRFDPMQCLRVE